MLRLRLVDGHDREPESAVPRHGPEPDDARRRLLRPGEDAREELGPRVVEQAHEVAAVVHRDLRLRVGDRVEVRVVGGAVLAAPGEDADPVACRECGRDVVLGRERVARGERRPRAPPAASVRTRFAVSVVTCRQAAMRRPARGRSRVKRSRIRRRTGISRSAHSIRRTPSSARPRSVTSWGGRAVEFVMGGGLSGVSGGRAACGSADYARGPGASAEEPLEVGAASARARLPTRRRAVDEPLLEAHVLAVAQLAVCLERRRVVGADVEHHLVAEPEQLGGHRTGDRRRVAAPPVVDVGHHVAHDAQARLGRDDVRPGSRHEAAAHADAVVGALGDRGRRQPGREAQLVEAVEVADLHRQEAGDVGRVRPERSPVDPHPDHLRARVPPGSRPPAPGGCAGSTAAYAARVRTTSRRIAAIPAFSPIAKTGCGA